MLKMLSLLISIYFQAHLLQITMEEYCLAPKSWAWRAGGKKEPMLGVRENFSPFPWVFPCNLPPFYDKTWRIWSLKTKLFKQTWKTYNVRWEIIYTGRYTESLNLLCTMF